MRLKLCSWGLLLLAAGLLVYALAVKPAEVAPSLTPLRALVLPAELEFSGVINAAAAVGGTAGQVDEAAYAIFALARAAAKAEETAEPEFARGPADVLRVVPTDGPISSEFGPRVLISFSKPRMHNGVDIKAPRGAPVKAAGAGTVAFSGRNGTYGLMVKIDHGQGLVTCYAHMDKSLVKAGDVVEAGQEIGAVGKTGKTTGANLHLEVRIDGQCVDPRAVFTWPPSPPRKPKPQLR